MFSASHRNMRRRASTGGNENLSGLAYLQSIESAFIEPFEDGADFWRTQLRALLRKAELSSLAAPIAVGEDVRVGAQLLEYLLRIVMAMQLANADELDGASTYWRHCIRQPFWAWIEYGPALWLATIEDSRPFPEFIGLEPWDLLGRLRYAWDHYVRRLLLFKQSMQAKIGELRDILEAELESVGSLRQHVSLLPQLRDTSSITEWCHRAVELLARMPGVTLPAALEPGAGGGGDAVISRSTSSASETGSPAPGPKERLQPRVILEEEPQDDEPLPPALAPRHTRGIPLVQLLDYPQMVMDAMLGARRRLRARMRARRPWQRLQPQSRLQRTAVYGALMLPFIGAAVWYATRPKQRQLVSRLASTFSRAVTAFYREHLAEPITAIVREVIFAQRRVITDMEALHLEKSALRGMLGDYYKEMTDLPEAEAVERAERCDMTLVTQAYENSMVTNYNAARSMVSGELVRTLLLQMQFVKVEMMELMRATEILMNENEINMRLMATVPAFLMGGGLFWVCKRLFYTTELRKSRPAMFVHLSTLVLNMERFLTLRAGPTLQHVQLTPQLAASSTGGGGWEPGLSTLPPATTPTPTNVTPRPHRSPKPPAQTGVLDTRSGSFFVESDAQLYSPNLLVGPGTQASLLRTSSLEVVSGGVAGSTQAQVVSDYSPWRRVLRARDTGKLLLMTVRLAQALRENRGRFSEEELRSMQEDLDQLVGDRGPMTVGQQLCIIQRMTRAYKALNSHNFNSVSWLPSIIV
mmetsp:Transcript_11571/g.35150  ORF Transcript_11571/g.35150 Transcript_11571/m.35150 type:complete len:754 (-) Transcript_11571:137-2398(-)|eukprot:CAMPEP_0118875698 /NCGR_PEP_ID=MMETSP1163-20130328/16605_1 /TAXON_ID=124430 /ORGANISM="Phaeomonas parva, Strain CCMP2877" /LENGTH=753 /DNA_ID=CAMNT_0006811229 /DNA_START=295 /DNA_END=2556 /DNA_ORIENTATION=-